MKLLKEVEDSEKHGGTLLCLQTQIKKCKEGCVPEVEKLKKLKDENRQKYIIELEKKHQSFLLMCKSILNAEMRSRSLNYHWLSVLGQSEYGDKKIPLKKHPIAFEIVELVYYIKLRSSEPFPIAENQEELDEYLSLVISYFKKALLDLDCSGVDGIAKAFRRACEMPFSINITPDLTRKGTPSDKEKLINAWVRLRRRHFIEKQGNDKVYHPLLSNIDFKEYEEYVKEFPSEKPPEHYGNWVPDIKELLEFLQIDSVKSNISTAGRTMREIGLPYRGQKTSNK